MSSGHVSYFKPSTRGWIVQRALALLYSEPQETLPTFLVPDLKKKKVIYAGLIVVSLWKLLLHSCGLGPPRAWEVMTQTVSEVHHSLQLPLWCL